MIVQSLFIIQAEVLKEKEPPIDTTNNFEYQCLLVTTWLDFHGYYKKRNNNQMTRSQREKQLSENN